jgi:16S rRNA (guanine527-N7)-methyltransferase
MNAAGATRRERLIAAAAELGVTLDEPSVERLLAYVDLLARWNATYNLTAVRDPDEMLTQHVVDCLAVIPAMQRTLGDAPRRILDVGSGGGLPGVVVATARPGDTIVCVDTVGKKAAFVRQVAMELQLSNLQSEHTRVEQFQSAPFEVITSRAFASLADFVRLTRTHLLAQGCWMAMKGKPPLEEIAVVPPEIDVFHVEPLQVPGLAAERCVVWMRPRP